MKRNYIFKLSLTLFSIALFSLQGNAQIRMVLVNPNTDTVTIKNFGVSMVDISTYELCDFPNYEPLNNMNMVVTGSLNLAAGAEVTIDASATSIDMDPNGEELGLYLNGSNFGNENNIVDYIQWISTDGFRESVAVTAGIWNTDDAIAGSVLQPYEYSGNGSENGVGFWQHALSTDEFSLRGFSISPNPANSKLFIQIPEGLNNARVEIFDILGKQVYSKLHVNAPIRVSDWSKGLYLVKVSSENNVQTRRFIKQ